MSELNPSNPRRRRSVWRWMILFGFITLVLSEVLIKAVSPLGDAIIASKDNSKQLRRESPAVSTSAPRRVAPAKPDHL